MDQSASEAGTRGVAVSDELFAPVGDDIELCYQTIGNPDDEPLLLIMGLGGPMTWWDLEFCEMLAERGFFVVRFDNRDTGRSSHGKGRVTRAMLVRAFTGRRVRPPYTLSAFARDALGLMDHLGWDSAHLAGVSMGGMIAQTVAIKEPSRVRSLTSIMSSTGKRTVGWQHPSLLPNLLAKRGGREAYIDSTVVVWNRIGSPGYPKSEEDVRAQAAETWDRGTSAAGALRHMMAVITQPNRGPRLHALRVPTLVVHGLADKMVHVSGGRATAAAVPGAELLLIDGMGHDLPAQLYETFADGIRRNADRAK